MNSLFNKSLQWSLTIAVSTFILAALFTAVSSSLLEQVSWGIGMAMVFILIIIGVIFDAIGLAAASGNEAPFHAMASKKVPGAKHGIYIIRHADRVSSFCNDVIGDISGIVSGTASAAVILQLIFSFGVSERSSLATSIAVIFTALVAAFTVGGKALGKTFAIHYSTEIIIVVGKFLFYIEKVFRVNMLNGNSKNRKKKRGDRDAAKSD